MRAAVLLLAAVALLVGPAPARAQITASDQLSARQVSYGTKAMYAEGPGLRDTVGFASFNVCVCLTAAKSREDALRLIGTRGLDVVGWQEANAHPAAYARLPGWTTVHGMKTSTKPHELAVSWRTSEFELVSASYTRMHAGSVSTRGDSTIFPSRFVQRVDLRSTRSPDDVLTVWNTHTNQHVERWDDRAPGRPYDNLNADGSRLHLRTLGSMLEARTAESAPSRWAVVLGDLNWDFRADQRTLLPRFVESKVGEWAVSSFESMGIADRPYTHPRSRRRIDYVFLVGGTPAHFRSQAVRTGYWSDHRPVIAWTGLD